MMISDVLCVLILAIKGGLLHHFGTVTCQTINPLASLVAACSRIFAAILQYPAALKRIQIEASWQFVLRIYSKSLRLGWPFASQVLAIPRALPVGTPCGHSLWPCRGHSLAAGTSWQPCIASLGRAPKVASPEPLESSEPVEPVEPLQHPA